MSPTDAKVVATGIAIVVALGLYRLFQHFRKLVPRPDPWESDVQAAVSEETARPICHRCLTDHDVNAWFCPKYGAAVGDYNNLLPYVQVFSEGEVLRNAISQRLRVNIITIVGFVLFTFCLALMTGVGIVLAPFYLYLFFRNVGKNRLVDMEENISNAPQPPYDSPQ